MWMLVGISQDHHHHHGSIAGVQSVSSAQLPFTAYYRIGLFCIRSFQIRLSHRILLQMRLFHLR